MNSKLKIATFVSSDYTYPLPEGVVYAPIIMAKNLSEGLCRKGHEVTFFAPGDTEINVSKIVGGELEPLKQNGDLSILKDLGDEASDVGKIHSLWDQYLLSILFQKAMDGKYDLVHVHPVDRALPFAKILKKIPVLYTLHDPISPWRKEVYYMFSTENQHFVSISDNQRGPAPDLNYAGTVYNGVDIDLFSFSEIGGENLLFSGRLMRRKGVSEAVQVAIRVNRNLALVTTKPNEDDYYKNEIKPFLGNKIKLECFLMEESIVSYYQNSKLLLFPIQWEEPFGLVMIEAMACGTPVVAFARGSVPEVIKDGETGFIVNSSEQDKRGDWIIKKTGIVGLCEAVERIYAMTPEKYKEMRLACRKHVEKNFSVEKMVEGYENVYKKILDIV